MRTTPTTFHHGFSRNKLNPIALVPDQNEDHPHACRGTHVNAPMHLAPLLHHSSPFHLRLRTPGATERTYLKTELWVLACALGYGVESKMYVSKF